MPTNKNHKTESLPKAPEKRHRPFYLTTVFICIAIAAFAGLTTFIALKYVNRSSNITSNGSSSSSNSESAKKSTDDSSKTNEITGGSENISEKNPDGKTPEQYDGEDPNNLNSLTGNITHVGFSDNTLVVRVSIDQYLTSGTCSLVVSDGTNTYTEDAALFADATASSCEGFDIPKSKIANFSNYLEFTINLTSGEKTGTITGVATL